MRIHTFLDKCNTILRDSKLNFGLNPVAELNMGTKVSRVCLHFNTNHLIDAYEDKTIADLSKTRHILKLFNCSYVNINDHDVVAAGIADIPEKQRATSFDVIVFTLPKDFDEGNGFDYKDNYWISQNRKKSGNGCTWYQCRNLMPWLGKDDNPEITHYADGVYDFDYIYREYRAYLSGGTSDIIVASQHFDYGAENFELDITDYVNSVITGERFNHGLCVMFSPDYESHPWKDQRYVGFFTNHTNLFFEPYLETIYDETIKDSRDRFYIGKENRLYLYVNADGMYKNLDRLPVCTIDGEEYPVTQATKGIYYASVKINGVEPDTIMTDVWSNIILEGEELEDVEMEFVCLAKKGFLHIGNVFGEKKELTPSLSGINDAETIRIGDVRRVDVNFRIPYTTSKSEICDSAEYRIYVKDINREIDVYEYSPIESAYLENFFIIDTKEMVPGDYFVDIKTKLGVDTKVYKEALRFTIASNVTEFYV